MGGRPSEELYVSPLSYDFSSNPRLLDRIQEGPHGYFRFTNAPFSRVVCSRLRSVLTGVPSVNLHGDAHLEQYAVTDLGRGLTDFDDSAKGPAALDLLRFGVSIYLAIRTHAPRARWEYFFEHFLEGYRAALEDPAAEAPSPRWVEEIRSRFVHDRRKYFQWIDSLMEPVDEPSTGELREAWIPYAQAMSTKEPQLDPRFFEVERIGSLKMGIGSALDEKYLVQVRGPSADPLDDVILEVKEVRSLEGIDCIEGTSSADPFRILLSQSRIAYKPYAYLGYIDYRSKKFWIHSWVDNYLELRLENLVPRAGALRQVVYDVGVQLGRGHPKIAGRFELELRRAQLKFLSQYEDRLRSEVEDLGSGVVEAWLRFKATLREFRDGRTD